jgi:hypothetical protein
MTFAASYDEVLEARRKQQQASQAGVSRVITSFQATLHKITDRRPQKSVQSR